MCCTDGLNVQRISKTFGTHPICCACETQRESTSTSPTTSPLLWVCAPAAVQGAFLPSDLWCSRCRKDLLTCWGKAGITKHLEIVTQRIFEYNLTTKSLAGEGHIWRNSSSFLSTSSWAWAEIYQLLLHPFIPQKGWPPIKMLKSNWNSCLLPRYESKDAS